MFEEINNDTDESSRRVHHKPSPNISDTDLAKQGIPIPGKEPKQPYLPATQAIEDLQAKKETSAQVSDVNPPSPPPLSRIVQNYDPDNDADVSAFLRFTAQLESSKNSAASAAKGTVRKRLGNTNAAPSLRPQITASNSTEDLLLSNSAKGKKRHNVPITSPRTQKLIQEHLSKIAADKVKDHGNDGQPSSSAQGSRESLGFGVGGVTGVVLSNGDRIGRPELRVRHEDK